MRQWRAPIAFDKLEEIQLMMSLRTGALEHKRWLGGASKRRRAGPVKETVVHLSLLESFRDNSGWQLVSRLVGTQCGFGSVNVLLAGSAMKWLRSAVSGMPRD